MDRRPAGDLPPLDPVRPCQPGPYTPGMNAKPVQPDLLAPIPHVSRATSVGSTCIAGPILIDCGSVGIYLTDRHLTELRTLLLYAAQRLDSSKVSPELRESGPIVRRVLGWIATADQQNAAADARHAATKPGFRDAPVKPS